MESFHHTPDPTNVDLYKPLHQPPVHQLLTTAMQTSDKQSVRSRIRPASTRRVCLTGASGFIGRHLAAALVDRGHHVNCFVRPTSQTGPLKDLGAQLTTGDVTDENSLRNAFSGADVVYHLAGSVKAVKNQTFTDVNQHGTAAVARACADQFTPPTLIIVSSLAAAGPAPPGRLRVETDPASPISNYGRSKFAGELAAQTFAGKVPITIVRPPIVFGEGDPETFQMIRPIARFGIHLTPSFSTRNFSLIHAHDLADAIILAAQQGQRVTPDDPTGDSGRYFLSGDEHPTYAELGRLIGAALDRRNTWVIPTPEFLTWAVAAAAQCKVRLTRRPSILNLDKAREATAGSWTCSAEKARRDLGFQTKASLADRLRQTIAWYRAESWL